MIACGFTLSYERTVSSPFVSSPSGLVCDGVRVAEIADAVGTPVYVYSASALRAAYRALDEAFAGYPHRVHYALKANSTLAIVRLLREAGSHADANSGGEVQVALRAGFAPEEIVFTGVGKSREELAQAIAAGVGTINAESPGEVDRIAAIAAAQGRVAQVALRVNPDIDAKTNAKISTGLRTNKFGVALDEARAIYRDRLRTPGLRFTGVHIHIGSQITSLEPLVRAADALATLSLALRDDGVPLEHMDLGGGLGIAYDGGAVITPHDYAQAVLPALRRCGLPVVLEPGRSIVAHSGALVARVVDTKQFPGGRTFAVLDAGMGELVRPAMYGSFHRIVPVTPRAGAETPWDIVGPICESSDVFGTDRLLPPLAVDDLVAILDAGAYGSVMASNYLRHPLSPEVLVDGDAWRVIRRRQTFDEMLSLEV